MFSKQISLKEVHLVARSMAKGKSLGLNKFVIKFYTFVWDLIEEDFFQNDRGNNQRRMFAQ